MILHKPTRFKSEKNLIYVRTLPCMVCGRPSPSDAHHFKTVGAGGDDYLKNLISLCRGCHEHAHRLGRASFFKRFGDPINSLRISLGLPKIEL